MNDRRLVGSVVPVETLSARDVGEMYGVFARLYDRVDETTFRTDLAAKDWVLLLRGGADAAIRGFSTILLVEPEIQGETLDVIFSGDTGIDPRYWGGQALVRAWAAFMGELRASRPHRRLYWFLISKGYRTYLYLPFFFHAYYPRPGVPTPPFERALVDTLGALKYPRDFNPATGVIEFAESHGQLTARLAEIPQHRRDDPYVRFFLERNPGYARGHELCCVAEVSPENMRGLPRQMLLEGARPLLAVS
jgi:hypothetical protein